MGDAGEIAEHHAEAVIERHRNADAVAISQALRLADEIAVVEDIVMGQRRAFSRAGGAAGELDVDRIVELQLRRQFRQELATEVAAHAEHVIEAQEAPLLAAADADQRRQMRQSLCLQFVGSAAVDFRRQLAQHADIVAGLEELAVTSALQATLLSA